jgi:hypothetical protein
MPPISSRGGQSPGDVPVQWRSRILEPFGCTWAPSARSGIAAASDRHLPAAPYEIINNVGSLFDVSDLVFIHAPGTGFSRIAGKERLKSPFYGVDGDARATSRNSSRNF